MSGSKGKIVREFLDEVLVKNDPQAASKLLASDLVVHFPGRNPLSGDHKGPEGFFGLMGQLMDKTGGTPKLEVHDITDAE